MWSVLFAVMLVVGYSQESTAMSVDGLARMDKLLSSSSSSSPSTPLAGLARGHGLGKRAVLDQSCKGIYDRELFKKIDRVCDDCYNLYRKPYVGVECRANCYKNHFFRQCLDDLLLVDEIDEYINAVQTVGK